MDDCQHTKPLTIPIALHALGASATRISNSWGKEMPKSTDGNQAEIVADLRKAGATVQTLHEVGYGCPDLVVGYRGINYLIEIKTEYGILNSCQVAWHWCWRGQVDEARTSEEALRIIGAIE